MMAKREKKMVHVLQINSDDLPARLDQVAALFQKAWDDTPPEYRDDMAFYKWGKTYYDSAYVEFEAYYLRDETDAEMADRIRKTVVAKAQAEAREREMLDVLKRKYG